MSKAPAIQFYVKDWLSDPQLRMASFHSKGIWIDILCLMWESQDRGKLTGTASEFCKMLGSTEAEFEAFLIEAKRLNFALVTKSNIEGNEEITLENRRMVRDEKDRKNNALRQARFKSNAKSNAEVTAEVTPPSSTASPKKEIIKKKTRQQKLTDDEYFEALKNNPAYQTINFEFEKNKCQAWCLGHNQVFSRRRLVNWLNRAAEKPLPAAQVIKPAFGLSADAEARIREIEERENAGH